VKRKNGRTLGPAVFLLSRRDYGWFALIDAFAFALASALALAFTGEE
jgi:hypothetical protein